MRRMDPSKESTDISLTWGLTLLSAASLPLKFWTEAFKTVVHIINLLPFPVLGNQSPHTLLFPNAPDYTVLRTFGCACYPLLQPYNKYKLDFCSSCCIFLGYNIHNCNYIYLSSFGKVYISRHIIFQDLFPYNIP